MLASDGRVNVLYQRAEGRGRPVKVYGLSPALAGDNLAALAAALLEESTIQIEALAKHLLDAGAFAGQPVAKRLALVAEKLNPMHYHSRWEAGAEGPRVIFGRCPYAVVIEKHPELCRMDASLLENVLGKEVRQLAKIEKAQGMCVFAVR
jgi:predicted ArsR family transcriptional regulator